MADATKDASSNRRAFKAGIFYIVCQLFVRGITFLMTPVFTRLLSQEQYNQYKIFESWLLIFAPVMSLCPVSYTHLDVYKRQDLFCAPRSAPGIRDE